MADVALLEADGLWKVYGTNAPVLAGASLHVDRGESVSLVGTSGAGKSTLLSLIAGLLRPDAGEVRLDGQSLSALNESGRARLRGRRIGVVLQSGNLIGFLTAAENVAMAVELAGGPDPAGRARGLLAALGLEHRRDEYPRRLSGGEARRAALAVALANEPDLLLADEITAELDGDSAARVIDLILDVSQRRDLAVLLVTHAPALAARAQRCLRIDAGRVAAA